MERNDDKRIEEMLKTDDELKGLFDAFEPQLSDGGDFMQTLTRKIEAVEYIKRHQEAQLRRYRIAVVVSLVLGVVSGGVLFAIVAAMTGSGPLFTFDSTLLPLVIISEHSRTIALLGIAVAMSFGVVSIVNTIQGLLNSASPVSVRIKTR